MKFRTRLMVTFMTIVLLPLCLTFVAFFAIGTYLINREVISGNQTGNYERLSNQLQDYMEATEESYNQLCQVVENDAAKLEDTSYLESINLELTDSSSYLLVRKGNEVFYSGNKQETEKIFDKLPEYGSESPDEGRSYYINDLKKLIKQVDFTFLDGSEGSAFIVTRVNVLISQKLLIDMIVAIIIILIFTSLMLTRSFQKGVFNPIKELNIAMQNIAEGNLEYRLPEPEKSKNSEIGELYHNYEDMRLRLKESAEEKIRHEKQNKELISNISHDLKTPITSIKGYVEGIMDGVADTPEKMDKYIKTVYNKANDMDKLINELTLYSGIDSNRIPYTFHRINVSEYFGDCIEEVGLDLESKNIKLDYSNLVDEKTMIIADPEQLKRVINNIISNSVKYMDSDHGEIAIRILDEVDAIRVEIEDNGRGIAAKDLPKIFERFYRTDISRNSMKGGTGIGLSIVKKIIEDHGGYIWATSKEGEGTCMHFVIRKYQEGKE